MIILKFLKQQNWWYGTISIVLLYLFINFYHSYLALGFLFAGAFLVSYSLKFAGKYNNEWIDLTKLIYYFLFLTACILGHEFEEIELVATYSFPFVIVYLYSYSLLNFYQNEMEQKDKKIKTSTWLIVQLIQTVLTLLIVVWAITQKVEADKQKDYALQSQKEASKYERLSMDAAKNQKLSVMENLLETAKLETIEQKERALKAQEEALLYREKYEELLKKRK